MTYAAPSPPLPSPHSALSLSLTSGQPSVNVVFWTNVSSEDVQSNPELFLYLREHIQGAAPKFCFLQGSEVSLGELVKDPLHLTLEFAHLFVRVSLIRERVLSFQVPVPLTQPFSPSDGVEHAPILPVIQAF